MYKYGIQVALTELPERVPAIFRGSIHAVARQTKEAGYDAMELYIYNPAQYDAKEFAGVASDHGLGYSGICTGLEKLINQLCVTDDDTAIRKKAVDRLKEHLDFGAAIGCPVVVGTMRGNIASWAQRHTCLARLGDAMRTLNAYAEQIGADLLVENILQYVSNYLNTLDEVSDFIRSLGLSRVKLHIDTHSMHMEETQPFDAVRRNGDILGYVHFSDSNRGYPGSGVVDFKAYFHALMDVHYHGYIVSEYQPYPTAMESAVRGLQYMKLMEQAAEIERLTLK